MSQEELLQLIDGAPQPGNDANSSSPTTKPNEPAQGDPSPGNGQPAAPNPRQPASEGSSEEPGGSNRPSSFRHLVQKSGWTQEQFLEVQNKVHTLAGEKLDVSNSYQKQRKATINSICEAVKKEHSIARGFEHSWVITDMLKVYLKKTSEASRKRKLRNTTTAVSALDEVLSRQPNRTTYRAPDEVLSRVVTQCAVRCCCDTRWIVYVQLRLYRLQMVFKLRGRDISHLVSRRSARTFFLIPTVFRKIVISQVHGDRPSMRLVNHRRPLYTYERLLELHQLQSQRSRLAEAAYVINLKLWVYGDRPSMRLVNHRCPFYAHERLLELHQL
ncbi:hypothetical protein B0H13DRAFT_2378661 [Mycena leptocephala]|nr:hypothetical protein B0H13DRAFT_2378661 [Mycena leptocephala]